MVVLDHPERYSEDMPPDVYHGRARNTIILLHASLHQLFHLVTEKCDDLSEEKVFYNPLESFLQHAFLAAAGSGQTPLKVTQ